MNYKLIKGLNDCYVDNNLGTIINNSSNDININDVTIDHLIYGEIKRHEREQREFERPYLRLPLSQYKPEIKRQEEDRLIEIGDIYDSPEETDRGVVIIDYLI